MSSTFCGFCGEDPSRAWHILAGPGIAVCDRCVARFDDVVSESDGHIAASAPTGGPFSSCSFCGKGAHEVGLVVGAVRHGEVDPVICHGCVRLCADILGGQGVPFTDPWFEPLRSQAWIRATGAPIDLVEWAHTLDAAIAHDERDAPDWRRRVADAIGKVAWERQVVLGYHDARTLADVRLDLR